MKQSELRAEILVEGLVQGVGYRYFALRKAIALGLKGYTKNLYDGSVLNVVEGPEYLIQSYFSELKIGPSHAHVRKIHIKWSESKNEFSEFEVKY